MDTSPQLPDCGDRGLDLYWIPLGAGATVVRVSGRIYEAVVSTVQRRHPRDLYHSALVAIEGPTRTTMEMTPIQATAGHTDRGVVAGGAVGSRLLGHLRVFRYEIRRWPDGVIPDLAAARARVRVTDSAARIQRVLELVEEVPTPVWGRDEIGAGEMWNSNSVISWTLTRAGLLAAAGPPPPGGRAPGWDAGVHAARRFADRGERTGRRR